MLQNPHPFTSELYRPTGLPVVATHKAAKACAEDKNSLGGLNSKFQGCEAEDR